MNPRRAAAALLALSLLAGALPATALVVPKFSGTKSGAPAAAAAPDGNPSPHAKPGAAAQGGRVPHPELLRAAAAAEASDTVHGRTQADGDTDAAARDQAARDQAAQAQPWAAAPHMRVHSTGDPTLDAALLKSLNADLATPFDPDRLRAGSLADDALADDTLASLMPRRPDDAQQQLWRFLRWHPPQFDRYLLTQALRPLRGDMLLVMAHVDDTDGALVFKARNGRPVRLPMAEFEQAARDAGVQLLIVGCKSARHTSAGFVDNLNALDAARAMARAAHARPSTMFELFNALSGPQRVMAFNPSTFSIIHTVELTAGPDGAVLSTLHWSGPAGLVVVQAAAQAASAAPALKTAASYAGWWSNPALPWLGATVLLSLLAGTATARSLASEGDSVAAVVSVFAIFDVLGHLLLLPLLLTVLAEAVAGANGGWWAWIGGLLLLMVAAGCVAFARSDPPSPRERGLCWLLAARAVILALPLLAVAILHTGWLVWPEAVMRALLALYGLGRPLPGPWLMLGSAVVLVWVSSWVYAGVQAAVRRRSARQARAGQRALWLEQLAADGVSGAAARKAVAARAAFERRCAAPVACVARWDQAKMLSEAHAPDTWAGHPQRHWRLVAVPLLARTEGVAPQVGFGLVRAGSPFMHPLPPVLLQRWHEQDLPAADVPVLLAQIEPRLVWTDFLSPEQQPRPWALMLLGAGFALAFASLAWLVDPGSGARLFWAGASALMLSLLVLWPAAGLARRRWQLRWLQGVRPQAPPANAQPATAAAAG